MLGAASIGDLPVSDESIMLDIQVSENESIRELCHYAEIGSYFDGEVQNVEEELCNKI